MMMIIIIARSQRTVFSCAWYPRIRSIFRQNWQVQRKNRNITGHSSFPIHPSSCSSQLPWLKMAACVWLRGCSPLRAVVAAQLLHDLEVTQAPCLTDEVTAMDKVLFRGNGHHLYSLNFLPVSVTIPAQLDKACWVGVQCAVLIPVSSDDKREINGSVGHHRIAVIMCVLRRGCAVREFRQGQNALILQT